MCGALWGQCGLGSSSLALHRAAGWHRMGDGWVGAEQDCVLRGRWWGLPPPWDEPHCAVSPRCFPPPQLRCCGSQGLLPSNSFPPSNLFPPSNSSPLFSTRICWAGHGRTCAVSLALAALTRTAPLTGGTQVRPGRETGQLRPSKTRNSGPNPAGTATTVTKTALPGRAGVVTTEQRSRWGT